MSGWQPIETAPIGEDTDVIVFWRDSTGQAYVALAFYRSQEDIDAVRGLDDWSDGDIGWWTYTNSLTQEQIQPTHWMPYTAPK